MTSPKEACRILNRYAKPYAHGAFAVPTSKDIEAAMARGGWHEWPGVRAVSQRLTRDSTRTDWTGRRYLIPGASRVISFLAVDDGAVLPDLSAFSRVYAYAEDERITHGMQAQGREVSAVKITASSDIVNCWGRPGSAHAYKPWDMVTLARLNLDLPRDLIADAASEASRLTGWRDDYPFYSDGSWDALSLRGFNPADPTWGIKPSEMSKTWWKQNPQAARYKACSWTTLAEYCPAAIAIAGYIGQTHGELERVRLLRMRSVSGTGTLSRHTDITDRAAGTRDGQIVRYHIPLITFPQVTMTAWNLRGEPTTAHLGYGEVWYLDARKPHAVQNASGNDRIHLVIDVHATQRCREVITQGLDVAA